ncbi:DUF2167 domain-containing protein [Deinococcus roseus]|nr:DUF2167 domain-containing protein [Deinococcus roseus]
MKKALFLNISLLGLSFSQLAFAQQDTFDPVKFEQGLHYQHGQVSLLDQKVNLQIPADLRYLDAADAQKLLEEGWGNPTDTEVLGMLIPANTSPMSKTGWGVVITYQEDGHISDKDARRINYKNLLTDMQREVSSNNKARQDAGYPTIELIGWATMPKYDDLTHKMYWAKELSFGGDINHTLNYDVRVLGRTGVLNLNAVADMSQLDQIRDALPGMLEGVAFTPGNRYEDFQAGKDKLAEYGLAALVAGGLGAAAAKTGFLTVILLLLKKFFVVVIAALVGLFRLFTGRNQKA